MWSAGGLILHGLTPWDPSGGRQVDEGPDFVRLRVHEDGSDLNTEETFQSRCNRKQTHQRNGTY